jgi:hypothetical protein
MHRGRAGKLVVPAVVLLWNCAGEFGAAVSGGALTLHWSDRSTAEKLAWDAQPGAIEYVARIERLDGSEAPSERRTTSTFVSAPALQALYRYRAAACNRVGCSLYRAAP